MDRKKVEKGLNTVLWIVVVLFGGAALKAWFEKNMTQQDYEQATTQAPALFKVEEHVPDAPNEWLDQHFAAPIDAMGEAPEGWSEVEAGLDPASCATCHPKQFAEWKTSWHHLGMGPGMMGQLVDDPGQGMINACQRCHAPNAEQYPTLDDAENPAYDESLRSQGLTCAGCHVRDHTRFGPPTDKHPVDVWPPVEDTATPDDGEASDDSDDAGPHDGFVAMAEFQDARFCERCHDFRDGEGKVLAGKKLQETYAEWRHTPAAAEGQTCQSCHMPDGEHTFKGVHDKEMVQSAFEAEAKMLSQGDRFNPVEVEFTITNVNAAHRMPTYTTPRIVLVVEQVDASGAVIDGTRQDHMVARITTLNLQEELLDTRLMPGESATLPYRQVRAPEAVGLVARVEVWPDEQYRLNYQNWLDNDRYPNGTELLQEALQAATDSRYVAWERSVSLDD